MALLDPVLLGEGEHASDVEGEAAQSVVSSYRMVALGLGILELTGADAAAV